ncbi:hypothetical protein H4R21_003562, partial [Coemansia helicoidea]
MVVTTNLGLIVSAGCIKAVRSAEINVHCIANPVPGLREVVERMQAAARQWSVRELRIAMHIDFSHLDLDGLLVSKDMAGPREVGGALAALMPELRRLECEGLVVSPVARALFGRLAEHYAGQLHVLQSSHPIAVPRNCQFTKLRKARLGFGYLVNQPLPRIECGALEELSLLNAPPSISWAPFISGGDPRVVEFASLKRLHSVDITMTSAAFLRNAEAVLPAARRASLRVSRWSAGDHCGLPAINRILGRVRGCDVLELAIDDDRLRILPESITCTALTQLSVAGPVAADTVLAILERLPSLSRLSLGGLDCTDVQTDISIPAVEEGAVAAPLCTSLKVLAIRGERSQHSPDMAVAVAKHVLLRTPAMTELHAPQLPRGPLDAFVEATLERQRKAVTPGQTPEYPEVQSLTAPHIESFNSIWEAAGPRTPALVDLAMELLGKTVVFDGKANVDSARGARITLWVDQLRLDHPALSSRETRSANRLVYPTECRQRGISYRGRLSGVLHYRVDDGPEQTEERNFGQLPVMVRSSRCNLQGMGPAELIRHHEEPEEMGGYFIVNGNEKVVRLLIAQRRNHVLAIQRPSYGSRGPGFTPFATQIRCVRRDQTSQTITMHYLSTGNLLLRFSIRKQEYMVPLTLVLRALVGASDREIFESITGGDADNIFVRDRIELLLRAGKEYSVHTREQALAYLGDKFRVVMYAADDATNAEIGRLLLDRLVMVHLDDHRDKFNMLAHMARKLYAVVSGECREDNPDAQQMQEVYMPGHLYLALIKERVEDYLLGIRAELGKDA